MSEMQTEYTQIAVTEYEALREVERTGRWLRDCFREGLRADVSGFEFSLALDVLDELRSVA